MDYNCGFYHMNEFIFIPCFHRFRLVLESYSSPGKNHGQFLQDLVNVLAIRFVGKQISATKSDLVSFHSLDSVIVCEILDKKECWQEKK